MPLSPARSCARALELKLSARSPPPANHPALQHPQRTTLPPPLLNLTRMSLSKAVSPALKEIRLHLCQSSPSSSGVRSVPQPHLSICLQEADSRRTPPSQFILNSYPALKQAHPDLKILVREAKQIQPKVYARFGAAHLSSSSVFPHDDRR